MLSELAYLESEGVEEKHRIISDWFFKEFAPAWLDLAELPACAEDARTNGASANWSAAATAAAAAANDECARAFADMPSWKGTGSAPQHLVTKAVSLATADVGRIAGSDIVDEIPKSALYDVIVDIIGAASIAATYGAAFAAARCEADKSRGRKFFDFWRFWDATKKAALDKAAYQAAYEAAFDRLYPTAETLHWSVMELVRQLNLTRFLWGPLP